MRSRTIYVATLSLLLLVLSALWSPGLLVASNAPPHLVIMLSNVGVREHGHNRGPDIDKWNRAAGVPLGSPYCASFVAYCYTAAGVRWPATRSALARSYEIRGDTGTFTVRDVLTGERELLPGDAGIMHKGRTIQGHIYTVVKRTGRDWVKSVEANTNCSGGHVRDGTDGVCIKYHNLRTELFSYFGTRSFTRPRYSS